MKLPKWVVKGVKDDFTLEKAELKIRQQEEKIRRLNIQIGWLKFNNLSDDEREWVVNTFALLTWHWYFSKELDEFVCEYIKYKDRIEREMIDARKEDLPF